MKQSIKTNLRRILSFILALAMVCPSVLSNLSVIAYAEGETSYTVNYYNYTGENVLYSESVAEGGTVTGYTGVDLSTVAPATVKNGPITTTYTFSHWALVEDETKAEFDLTTEVITEDIDLIAVYNEVTTGNDYSKLESDGNGRYWIYFNFKSDSFYYLNDSEIHSANLNFYIDVTEQYELHGHACFCITDTFNWSTLNFRGSVPYSGYFGMNPNYIVEGTYDNKTYSNNGSLSTRFDIEYLLGISDTESKFISSSYHDTISYLPFESQSNTEEFANFTYIQTKPTPKVTYYNSDGSTVLYEEEVTDGNVSVYAGEDLNKSTIKPANTTNGNATVVSEFSHWALLSDPTTEFDLTKPITSSVDLIAVYTTFNQYGVYYWSHDGSTQIYGEGVIEGETISGVYKGAPLDKTPAAPTPTVDENGNTIGYVFSHWAYKNDPTTPFDATTPIVDRVDLIAVYDSGIAYTVSYYDRLGENVIYTETTLEGNSPVGYPGTMSTISGYYKDGTGTHTFKHWAYMNNPEKEFVFGTDTITENTNLIAVYDSTYTSFYVLYYNYDKSSTMYGQTVQYGNTLGEYRGNDVNTYGPASYIDPEDNSTVTYRFSHWGNCWANVTDPTVKNDLTKPLTEPLTLIAMYDEIRTYKVYYWNHDGSTQIYNEDVEKGNTIGTYNGNDLTTQPAAPEAPADGQYAFSHWINKDTGEKFDISTPIEGETNLQAVYVNGYSVRYYDENKTTLIGTEGVETGKAASMSVTAPTKEYYTFAGWVNADGTIADLSNITANTNVYASYKLKDNVRIVNVYSVDYLYNLGYETIMEQHYIEVGNSLNIDYVMSFPTQETSDTRTTYTFKGWGDKEGNIINLTNITENIDLYPVFDKSNEYKVTLYKEKFFNKYSYESINSVWVTENEDYTIDTTLDKYIKKATTDNILWRNPIGWTFNMDSNELLDSDTITITKPINIYGVYEDYIEEAVNKELIADSYTTSLFYGNEGDVTSFSQVYSGHEFKSEYCIITIYGEFKYTYEDGTEKTFKETVAVIDDCELVNPQIATTRGNVLVEAECEYDGKTFNATRSVTVSTVPVFSVKSSNGLVIMKYPDKMDYFNGEEVDFTGLKVGLDGYFSSAYLPINNYTDYDYVTNYEGVVELDYKYNNNSSDDYVLTVDEFDPYTYIISHYSTKYSATFETELKFNAINEKSLSDFIITEANHVSEYNAGDYFSPGFSIFEITIESSDINGNVTGTETYTGTYEKLSQYGTFTYNDGNPLTEGQTQVPVTFTFTDTNETLTVNFNVTVGPKLSPTGNVEGYVYYWKYTLTEEGLLTYTFDGTEKGYSMLCSANLPYEVKEIHVDLSTYTDSVQDVTDNFTYYPLRYLIWQMDTVEKVELDFGDANVTVNLASTFYNMPSLKEVIFTGGTGSLIAGQINVVTSGFTNYDVAGLSNMFKNCPALENITWGNLDTSNILIAYHMFDNVGTNYSLEETQLVLDLSTIGLSKLRNTQLDFSGAMTSVLFENVTAKEINFTNYERTDSATGKVFTFNNCNIDTLDISVSTENYLINSLAGPTIENSTINNINLTKIPKNTTTLNNVISNTITLNNVSGVGNQINIENCTADTLLITDCVATVDISNSTINNDLKVNNLKSALAVRNSTLNNFELKDIDTTGTLNLTSLFAGTIVNGTLNLENISAASIILENAFSGAVIKSDFDLSFFDAYPITGSLANCFKNATFETLNEIDITGWNTLAVTSMEGMFEESPYEKITLAGLKTEYVSNFNNMFKNANVKDLNFSISYLDTYYYNDIFTGTQFTHIKTPVSYDDEIYTIKLPVYEYAEEYDYYWSDFVTSSDFVTYTKMPENKDIMYGWYVKYMTGPDTLNYYWMKEDETHTVLDLPITDPVSTSWEYGLVPGDIISNTYRGNAPAEWFKYDILKADGSTEKFCTLSEVYEDEGLVLRNKTGSYVINYYDEDKATLLYSVEYMDNETAKHKVALKDPYVNGNNYVITVSNDWYNLDTDEKIETNDWVKYNYNCDVYVKYNSKSLLLTDNQYAISGTLNKNNPGLYENVRIIVTNVTTGEEISSTVYTDTFTISELLVDMNYSIKFIDEATQTELLELEVASDLENLGINTMKTIDGYSYAYKKMDKQLFTLDIDTYTRIQYSGTVKYDNGTPLANKTLTLFTGGYKPDGSYNEVKATDITWKEYVKPLPDDWDRSEGPEGVNYYRLTYADMQYLQNTAGSYISLTGNTYTINTGAGTALKTLLATKTDYNGLELGYIINPTTGEKFALNLYSIADYQLPIEHYRLIDGVDLSTGWTNYNTDETIKTIVFDNTSNWQFTANGGRALKMEGLNKLKSVWFSPFITELPNGYIFKNCPELTNIIFMEPEKSQLKRIGSALFYGHSTFPNVKKLYIPCSDVNNSLGYRIDDTTEYNNSVLPNLEKLYVNSNVFGDSNNSGINVTTIDANVYTREFKSFTNHSSTGIESLTSFKWMPTLRFDNLEDLYDIMFIKFDSYTTNGQTLTNGFISGGQLDWVYFGNPNLDPSSIDIAEAYALQNVKDVYINVLKNHVNEINLTSIANGYPNTNYHFAYPIFYNLDGGYSNQILPDRYIDGWTEDDYIVIPNPHKDGYSFIGWKAESTGAVKVTQYETYSVLRQDRCIGDITLTALWEEEAVNPYVFKVTTDENGRYEFTANFKSDELAYLTYIEEDGKINAIVSINEAIYEDNSSLQIVSKEDTVSVEGGYNSIEATKYLASYTVNFELPAPTIVLKELDSIKIITPPNKVNYWKNEIFDPTGMVVDAEYKITWSDDSITYETENAVNYDYQKKDALSISDSNILVSYTDDGITKTAYQDITVTAPTIVSKTLKSIEIVTPPNKVDYFVDETFNPTGMIIDATYDVLWNDGNTTHEVVKDVVYDYDLKDKLRLTDNVITVSFTDTSVTVTDEQPITVKEIQNTSKILKSIEIVTPPDDTQYFEGEYFDKTGMIVDATYELTWDNGDVTYEIAKNVEYDYDLKSELKTTDEKVVVSFTDNGVTATDEQSITVESLKIISKVLDAIEIVTPPDDIEYFENEYFDKAGMVVDATYKCTWNNDDITYETVNDIEYDYNLKDKLIPENDKVIVSFTDTGVTATDEQPITVEALKVIKRELHAIEIVVEPDKVDYIETEYFDSTGMIVDAEYELTWNNGDITYETVNDVAYEYDNHNKLVPVDTKIIVSFTDTGITKTDEQPITVEPLKIISKVLYSIEIVTPPDKVEYIEDEIFDKTGMIVDATYELTWNNGDITYEVVKNVDYDYDLKDKLVLTDNKVTVSFTDNNVTKTDEQPITVKKKDIPKAEIVSKTLYAIEIVQAPEKIEYFEKEIFNNKGMIVDATYEVLWSDDSKTYEIVKDVKYDYDLKSELKLTDTVVTVSYTDTGVTKTDEQPILVKELKIINRELDFIEIVKAPNKVEYYVGENFDKTGMVVDATYKLTWSNNTTTKEVVKDVDYVYDLKEALKLTDNNVIVSYTDTGITKTDNQTITVKEKPIEVIKSVKGNITVNGKPLANTKVILHSDPITTYTDENGNYEFKNVTKEVHTLQIFTGETNIAAEVKVDVTLSGESDTGVFNVINADNNTKVQTNKNDNDYIVNCDITIDEPESSPIIKRHISGEITVDGKALSNTKITLHSEPKTKYTGENGKYVFNDVTIEEHTLTIFQGEDIVAEIKINVSDDKEVDETVFNVVKVNKNVTISTDIVGAEIIKQGTESNVESILVYVVNCDIVTEKPTEPPTEEPTPEPPTEPEPEPTPDTPKTGDETPIMLLAIVFIVSGIILASVYAAKKKDQDM